MTENPVLEFVLDKSAIQYIGSDLQRPVHRAVPLIPHQDDILCVSTLEYHVGVGQQRKDRCLLADQVTERKALQAHTAHATLSTEIVQHSIPGCQQGSISTCCLRYARWSDHIGASHMCFGHRARAIGRVVTKRRA